jgi:uncharacterized protein (DUF4415 family)
MMRKEYDFSKARKSPYSARLKKPVTIRLDEETVAYFKALAEELEVPYQTLINMYLRDCAAHERRPSLSWAGSRARKAG